MGRSPCCSGEHAGLNKGPWSEKEDKQLRSCLLENHNLGWRLVPKKAGLLRCGKSCRLRWMNYLRPDIKRGNFTPDEEDLIIQLHAAVGNKWSIIATHLPGRTDNEIKNLWNTRLRKLLVLKGTNPVTHQPLCNPLFSGYVKQCVKTIENMIIAELMAPSNSYNHDSYSKNDTCSLDVSLPSFIPPLQTSGSDEVFVQSYLVNSSFGQSALEVFTSTSLVEDNGDKDMNFIDDFLLDGVSCLPANSFGDYLGTDFRDNSSSSDLIEGVDSLESVGVVNLEEGLQYWN